MRGMSSLHNLVSLRKRTSIKEDDFNAVDEHISVFKKQQSIKSLKSADAKTIWERKSSGYRIVDLRLDRFMQALRFVLTYFSQMEPMCKAASLYDDAVSIRSYMNMILHKMDEMLSFCALQEGTGDLVGVIIASIFSQKHQRLFKIQMPQGDVLRQIMSLKNLAIAKALFYETSNGGSLVHIDVICVKSHHQKRGIGTALLRSCIARSSEFATTCVGEFTSGAAQTIAERLGFEILSEIPYKNLESEDSRLQIFESCYPENYSIACMTLAISPPVYHLPSTSGSTPMMKSGKKRTRTRKRKYKTK